MPTFDRSSAVGFGLNPLNRLSERRSDDAFIDAKRHDPNTCFLIFAADKAVLHAAGVESSADLAGVPDAPRQPLFSLAEVEAMGPAVREVFMGQDEEGVALFALTLAADALTHITDNPALEHIDLRSIAMRGLVPPALLGELGHAKAVMNWHQNHGFCANCGAASRVSSAGWRRDCDACNALHFPRVDPVVIMLAVDGDRCLLGRQPRFAPGMYSALAGFLEPGETIEDAVRREIHEEGGITCSHVEYFASQPWPFPSSLMIACFARATSTALTVDTNELEDARWFSRAEVSRMLDGSHADGLSAPKPFAIAHHLLKAFAEKGADVLTGA
jgi:NAD+ diphosphatase